jgi:hypothetical protein
LCFGTERNCRGAHGISGAEGRPAVPSTFDDDIVVATKKGVNPLERGGQVDFMADFQEMLDFSPVPKLDVLSKLDPAKTIPAEMRGQEIFFGKGQSASCHQPRDLGTSTSHRRKARRVGSRSWATCQWPWAKLLRRLGEPLRWPQISGLELLGEPAMANLLGCPNRANPSASEQRRPRAVRHSGPSQRSVSSGERMLAEGSSKQLPLVIVPRRRPTVQRSDPCYE